MKYCTLLLASLALASCARKAEVNGEKTNFASISFIDTISVDSLEQILYGDWDPSDDPSEIPFYTLSDITEWMCEDGLDVENPNIQKLVDIYNLSVAVNNIFSDFDLYNREDFYEEDVVNAIQAVDFDVIKNRQYRDSLENYRKKNIISHWKGSESIRYGCL